MYTVSKDGAAITWQCDKTVEEVQQYAEQQLQENDITEEDVSNDNDDEDDSTFEQESEEELCTVRSSQTTQVVSDEGRI